MQEGDRDGIESQSGHRRIFFYAPGITFSIIFAFPGDAKIALCWTYVGARLGRRLGGVLERSWDVFGRPRRPQDAHKTPQDGHKTPQDATMTVQDGSKTRPRCSQDAPKTHSRRKLRQDVLLRPRNAKTLKKPKTNHVFSSPKTRPRRAQTLLRRS